MPTQKVDINPAILVWARESIGLTYEEAAKKLAMSSVSLRMLEEGVGDVPLGKLRTMAEIYQRPFIAFFLSEPPRSEDGLPDFRLKPKNRGKTWSPALHTAFRRVAGQREVAIDLSELADEAPPVLDLRLDLADDAEGVGRSIRAWLDFDSSPAPRSEHGVFNAWTSLIEDKGILVTQVSGVPVAEMRGFSLGSEPFPVIALNGADGIRARTFTLIHELVHILLRRGALCDLSGDADEPRSIAERIESFCNAVAAAVLMPKSAVLGEEIVKNASSHGRWSDDDLLFLANRFGVSLEAMLLRLVTLGRASRDFYAVRRRFYTREDEDEEDARPGYLGYYRGKIRNLGRRYIRMVLEAYDRGEITAASLARYLDIKLKYIPRLIEELGTGT